MSEHPFDQLVAIAREHRLHVEISTEDVYDWGTVWVVSIRQEWGMRGSKLLIDTLEIEPEEAVSRAVHGIRRVLRLTEDEGGAQ